VIGVTTDALVLMYDGTASATAADINDLFVYKARQRPLKTTRKYNSDH